MAWYDFEGLSLLRLPGVFAPTRSDTLMLWRAVRDVGLPERARVLEVCTGSGAVALSAARAGAEVTAVDASRRAVFTVRLNARRNGLPVDARHGDLFAPVAGERFDVVLANPPYVPLPPAVVRRRAARAWDGGADGRLLLDRICREVPAVLAPGGTVALVHSSLADLDRTEELLAAGGLAVRRLAEERGSLGPLATAHLDHLRTLEVVDEEAVETMAVIAGTREEAGEGA